MVNCFTFLKMPIMSKTLWLEKYLVVQRQNHLYKNLLKLKNNKKMEKEHAHKTPM